MQMTQRLGEAIRKYMLLKKIEDKEFGLKKLAQVSNLSYGYLNELLCGKKMPSIPTLCKIANALGVKASTLLAEAEEGENN